MAEHILQNIHVNDNDASTHTLHIALVPTGNSKQYPGKAHTKEQVNEMKAIFHKSEFSERSGIFFCLKTNSRRVGLKRQKKISFREKNSS